jgi:hypothetical protein
VLNPAKYDITLHQGATFELLVQYKDAAGEITVEFLKLIAWQ